MFTLFSPPPLHSTISMALAKCGALSRGGESVCIDFYHWLARGVKLGEGLPVFP